MRLVIAEDEVLLREGLVRLLREHGVDVAATAGTPGELLAAVARHRPDVALVDIRMPPTHTEEGLEAAREIRRMHPAVAVLVLSHYVESGYAMQLLQHQPESLGYLLKDRVSDVAVLVDAIRRVRDGECVLDPTIARRLVARPRTRNALDELTDREREVLSLLAEGRSNRAVAEGLSLSPKTVEAHIRQIFGKLGLEEAPDYHRRVVAVLTYLRSH
jgi:DNA-binding NarL/FixJ family response regulator